MKNKTDIELGSSTGHALSDSEYLDRHFAACQPEYEAMLKSVGLKEGWQLLDAGCGSGSFQTLISQLLGESGHITALDLAPENIKVVESRAATGQLLCPLETTIGPVTKLPYPNNAFDIVWCSAVVQYLTDEELVSTLNEFYRVVRPGGAVAIKDIDITTVNFWPPGPHLMAHLYQAMAKAGDARTHQLFRNYEVQVWLRKTGFVSIKSKTTLVERLQPLPMANQVFLKSIFKVFSERAKKFDLPAKDLAIWEQLGNVDSPNSVLNDPNFYYREGHILALGYVPL